MQTMPIDSKQTLTEVTRDLVKARPSTLTLEQLAIECHVTRFWLSSFACGQIADPSANKVQRVYERLAGRKLF